MKLVEITKVNKNELGIFQQPVALRSLFFDFAFPFSHIVIV